MQETLKRWGVGLFVAVSIVGVLACGDKKSSTTAPSNTPTVTACNSISYQGATFTGLGCSPGVASFTATTTQNGRTACFNITCSAGCISAARVC